MRVSSAKTRLRDTPDRLDPTGGVFVKPGKSGKSDTLPVLTPAQTHRQTRQDSFLEAFRRHAFISSAIEAMPLNLRPDRDTIYEWRRSDPAFARRFDAIEQDVTELYERSLAQVGLNPKHPQMVAAAKIVLTARNPQKYSDRLRVEQENTKLASALEELRGLIHRTLVDVCPHCKTKLAMKETLAKELIRISQAMVSADAA